MKPRIKLYADSPARRVRQQVGDLLVLSWVLAWVWLSRVVHDATLSLTAPGRRMEAAGTGLSGRLREAGTTGADGPLGGGDVRAPLGPAGPAPRPPRPGRGG